MRILISESQYRLLIETNINFHLSRRGDGFEDLDNIKPYGSDTIIMMQESENELLNLWNYAQKSVVDEKYNIDLF